MFKEFNLQDILSFEQRYRATFINSIGGFKSVALIGTKNSSGQTNLAIFNSLVHIGANPPLLGFIVRPDSVERHTLENI
ncbi:MAG: flavin oxidoreductase, partial [Bacteroidota bacterium]